MYKVRFHLGRGKHYKHWQVTCSDKSVLYYDPSETVLVMSNCKLVSNKKTAQKVKDSGVKDVCGWISCEGLWIAYTHSHLVTQQNLTRVWYNPIVDTEWHMMGKDSPVTNHTFEFLTTRGNRVYIA